MALVVVVVPPLDPVPWRPPPLGVIAATASAVAVAAFIGVGAWFVVPVHVTAPVLLLVVMHPDVAIAGSTVALAIVVALVLLAVEGGAIITAAAIVNAVAVVLMLRLTKSLMVLQSIAERMEVFVDATACLWLTVTACTLRPVPIKHRIEMFGPDCVPSNLAQL